MEREQGLFSAYFNAGQDALRGKLNDCRDLTEVEDAVRLYCYLDSELKEQEKQVLLLRYGLGGKAEYTQKQVAARLGISRSYVSRIEKNAIEKLRLRFAAS